MSTSYKRKLTYLALPVTALLLLGSAAYVSRVLFAEDLTFGRISLAYVLTIRSDVIRNFPVIESLDVPVFYYSAGDGPKPPAQGIRYLSRAAPKRLRMVIGDYLRGYGFEPEPGVDGGEEMLYHRGSAELIVMLFEESSGEVQMVATGYELR